MADSPANYTESADSAGGHLTTMRVSPYDRAASMLVSLLLLVGFVVGIMFLLFLTLRIVSGRHAVPITLMDDLDPAAASLDSGSGEDFEEPGLEELEQVPEPQLADMLAAVTDAVTARPDALEELMGDYEKVGRGTGDGRRPGPGGSGTADVIPFGRRTKIHWGETSLDVYAMLLDNFGIALAAAGGGKAKLDYAAKFSQSDPETWSGSPQEEKRVHLIWRHGSRLAQADRKLLARAGVDTVDRLTMQFLPPPITTTLKALEKEKMGSRSERQLKMTIYGVQKVGDQYQFYVREQQYRRGR